MKLLIILNFFPICILALTHICLSDAKTLDQSTHDAEKFDGNLIRYKLGKFVDVQIGKGYGKIPDFIEKGILSEIESEVGVNTETTVHAERSNKSSQECRSNEGINENVLTVLEEVKSVLHENALVKQGFTSSVDLSEYVDRANCYPVGIDKKRICPRGHPIKTSRKSNETIPRSCKEVLDRGNKVSGVYQIQPIESKKPFDVLCDMETRGGGWTYIQKRYDESQDFDLGRREYKLGFGDLAGEFWIGLENIYQMTAVATNELLVEITDRDNVTKYANYKSFQISPEADGYALNILKDYTGDAGDSLTYAIGSKFTTKDFDLDLYGENCAVVCVGGWWFNACYHGFLNSMKTYKHSST